MGMYLAFTVLGLLAAFGLLTLCWLLLGRLLLPVPLNLTVSLTGHGDGVRALHWLRRTGLWRGDIRIVDGGLSPRGLAVARRLVEDCHAQLHI